MEEPEPVSEMIQAVAPAVLLSSLKFGCLTGAIGASVGGVAGVIRSKSPLLFSLVSGVQCFTLGTSYWTVRQSLLLVEARKLRRAIGEVPTYQRKQASTLAGGVSGATTAVIFRGPSNVIPGAIAFSIFGFLGQTGYDLFDSRPVHSDEEQEEKGILERILRSRFSPLKPLSSEEYENMLNEKRTRIEAEIALIDEELEKLKTEEQPNPSLSENDN